MNVELRPRFRGVLHQYAFFVSVAFGALLVVGASGTGERVSAAVFAGAVATMFAVSALYHRVTWRPRARRWMRRLDHAAIFLLIAGTYTPFGLLALSGVWRWTLLPIVWGGALAAIALKLAWIDGAEVADRGDRHRPRLARDRRAAPALGACRPSRGRPSLARRRALHARRRGLRHAPARSGTRRLRLPRAVPCARDRGGRVPVRGRRVVRPRLSSRSCGAWAPRPTSSGGHGPSRRAASERPACPAARTDPARPRCGRRG